jgi:Homeodomain-like domain
MRSPETRAEVLRLVAEGVNDCEIARRLELPRTTVRDIRRPRPSRRSRLPLCPRCWRPIKPLGLTPERYAELLGLYLGDGCISRLGRTYSFRLSLDTAYPGIIEEARALLSACFPGHAVQLVRADSGATSIVQVYSLHLPCLFPQHGPGKKHERTIRLERWQQACVDAAPWALLRGLFRSDGCAFINRTGRYEYLSYDFANYSADVLDLYAATCDQVGVEYRRYARRVRLYRRASVALFKAHVGLKF